MSQVTQLVDQEVASHRRRKKQQTRVQADVTEWRAAPPARSLRPDLDLVRPDPYRLGLPQQPWFQIDTGLCEQPLSQQTMDRAWRGISRRNLQIF